MGHGRGLDQRDTTSANLELFDLGMDGPLGLRVRVPGE